MCSPEELQRLLKDEQLFKQYIILKIDRMSERIEEATQLSKEIKELSEEVGRLSERIDRLEKDISFFKKLIVGLITVICALLGINLGVV